MGNRVLINSAWA